MGYKWKHIAIIMRFNLLLIFILLATINAENKQFNMTKNNYYLKKGQKEVEYLQVIENKQIHKALTKHGFVTDASSLLISPSRKDYINFYKMLKKMEPFGLLEVTTISLELEPKYKIWVFGY